LTIFDYSETKIMEKYTDTHAHLYLPEFDNDRNLVIENAISAGVMKILLPNIDSSSIENMNRTASAYPDVCYSMMGLHPTSVKENYKSELSIVESEIEKGRYIGVGEIGIDLYWDKSNLSKQTESFRAQLDLALKHDLPVVIHARESFTEILSILKDYRNKGLKGVFHAFTGSLEIALQVTKMGFHIGIGGILTYKKSDLPSVLKDISLQNVVLETDSPYLAPAPFRGKRNESSYIPVIAQVIQQIKEIPLEEVAFITTRNASKLFGLDA
jgi:TatD DNase family protein